MGGAQDLPSHGAPAFWRDEVTKSGLKPTPLTSPRTLPTLTLALTLTMLARRFGTFLFSVVKRGFGFGMDVARVGYRQSLPRP